MGVAKREMGILQQSKGLALQFATGGVLNCTPHELQFILAPLNLEVGSYKNICFARCCLLI